MERNELERKTIAVIAYKLEISSDKIKLETELANELGIDSIDMIDIVFGLEDEFEINIFEMDMDGIKTVKDLCDLVEKKLVNNYGK